MEFDRQQLETALRRREHKYLPLSLHVFDTVASTNLTVWNLLEQGAVPGCVVIATSQTAGRGQWGRQWSSPGGGLYLSVAIALQLEASHSYQLTLALCWGIAKQLQKCGVNVGIKWPNDLVLSSRKLGGILTETKVHKGKITQAVVGVGINWSNSVPETGINLKFWQAKEQKGVVDSLEMLALEVLLGIESGVECLCEKGVNILLSDYLNLLTNMGDKVDIKNHSGTVVGVTSTGELRIKMETYDTSSVITPEICLQPGTISLGYKGLGNRD